MSNQLAKEADFVRRAVKRGSAIADVAIPPRRHGIAVLIYHRVGARTPVEVDLDPVLFDEQMAALASLGLAVSMDEVTRLLSSRDVPDGPPRVSVTFDDGTADFVDVALPILVKHRIPATLYLATAHIDGGLAFPNGGTPLSWSGVRESLSTGLVTIGSHTHTHVLLDRLDAAQIDAELDRSIELIAEHAGVAARDFAYPKAVAPSRTADVAVRRRFRTAALAGTRLNAYGRTDIHRLSRSPVQTSDGMHWFLRKIAGGMRFEDVLRRAVNRRRYANATT